MPRWTSCYIDKRAVSHKGQWGEYICERCGKHFMARMCAKKNNKHVFCSTKCKKDFQVKYDRPKIDDKIFTQIYNKYYELVRCESFKVLDGKYYHLLEDCMQLGFIELWKIYNRNKFNCSKKYIRKSIRHNILDSYKFWKMQEEKYWIMERLDDTDKIKRESTEFRRGIYQ